MTLKSIRPIALVSAVAIAASPMLLIGPPAQAAALCSGTFATSGTCTVPGQAGSTVDLLVTSIGGGGGGGTKHATNPEKARGRGGNGAKVAVQLKLAAGSALHYFVGTGGEPQDDTTDTGWGGAGGGGSSAVLLGSTLLTEPGGGGGGNAGEPAAPAT